MLELHSIKNLNTLSFLKLIDSLNVGISGKKALDAIESSLSIQERLLLIRLTKDLTESVPNYFVEFQEEHAPNTTFDWIASLNSIDSLESRLNKSGKNYYELKKGKKPGYYNLYYKKEYCAYIRPIEFQKIGNEKPRNYENFVKRVNKSKSYQEVDQLFQGHSIFRQLNNKLGPYVATQAEDLTYGYRVYTNVKTLCKTMFHTLSALSGNIKLGHCFDMISVLVGHPNWNTFKASNSYRSLGNGIPAAIMTMEGQPKYQYYQDIYSALADGEVLLSNKMAHETKILPTANHISILQTPHYDTECDYVTPFTENSVYITSIVPWEDYIGPDS